MLTITLNPALDICTHIPVVEPDRKMHCSEVVFDPGGGGINVARVAVRLGCAVTAAAFLEPRSSERFLWLLDAEGVSVDVIEVEGPLRESLTVVEGSTERQYRFVLPGPRMSTTHFEMGLERIQVLSETEDLVVISGSSPPGVSADDVARLVEIVRAGGATVIVDTSGEALAAVASVGVSLIKPSVRELSVFVGGALSGHREIEAAARRLLARGPNTAALVSLGESGALLVQADDATVLFHAPRVHARSTVGAGDSLVAGFAVAIAAGATMADAARFGVAAGSAATLAVGTGLCQADDVDRLAHQVLATTLST